MIKNALFGSNTQPPPNAQRFEAGTAGSRAVSVLKKTYTKYSYMGVASSRKLTANEVAEGGGQFIISDDVARAIGPPSRILPWLLLGSSWDAADASLLDRENVVCIVNTAKECAEPPKNIKRRIRYERLVIDDFELDRAVWKKIVLVLDSYAVSQKHGNDSAPLPTVLVHCMRGRSRSASAVLAYLMSTDIPRRHMHPKCALHSEISSRKASLTLKQAYEHVKRCRECIGPHHFMREILLQLDREPLFNAEHTADTDSFADADAWREFEVALHRELMSDESIAALGPAENASERTGTDIVKQAGMSSASQKH